MYLLDTNILIYYSNGSIPDHFRPELEGILEKSFQISIITKLEYLGWQRFEKESFEKAKHFVSFADVINITSEVAEQTIDLRRNYNIRLADAVIAATAKVCRLTLITRNESDFANLQGLSLMNPFA